MGKSDQAATACLETRKRVPEGNFSSSVAGWGC